MGPPACTSQLTMAFNLYLHCLGEQTNSLNLVCMQRPIAWCSMLCTPQLLAFEIKA